MPGPLGKGGKMRQKWQGCFKEFPPRRPELKTEWTLGGGGAQWAGGRNRLVIKE